MYCPNCSQQQVSDEMRFCSRCGFPLAGVRDLIKEGGATAEAPINPYYLVFRGMRRGVWFMLVGFLLTLMVGFLIAVDEEFAVFLFFPLLSFIIGFIMLLYGTFVKARKAKKAESAIREITSASPAPPVTAPPAELPPARVSPAANFTSARIQTSEIIQPPSVTENTTRLLDDEGASRREREGR